MQISPKTKILIVSASTSPIYIYNLVKLGIKGYMTKGVSQVDDFINALKIIRAGQEYFSEDAANALAFIIKQNEKEFPLLALSPQEIEVVSQLIDGASIKAIGLAMHLSDKRIYRLRTDILQKLSISDSQELTSKFWRYFTKS
jgi:DNA-binding NarL/FixJ family response regulator